MQSLQPIQAEQVYISGTFPQGLTLAQFHALPCAARCRQAWRPAVRFAAVRGRQRVLHRSQRGLSRSLTGRTPGFDPGDRGSTPRDSG